ncbi:MAG: hypothetical protein NTV09_03390, partial [Bacteroidetes bacterium]|nr:hypothetical protein [Bacteroidota bacterium]
MKKILNLSFIIIFICSSPLLASNYYWVGGTGAWSDYAAHWATASGGTVFHVTIPSPTDDVYFDTNSFPASGDTVYLDSTITNCKTMDWSGAANAPVLYSTSNIRLNLYGSLILNNSLIWAVLGDIYLLSSTAGNIINTYGVVLQGQGSGTDLRFSGSGSWSLQDGISLGISGTIQFNSGTFLSNGFPISCGSFYINASASTSIMLDTSTIVCGSSWNVSNTSLLTLDADSTFITSNSFSGGVGRIYRDVVCGSIDDLYNDGCTFRDVQCSWIAATSSFFRNVTMSTATDFISGTGNTFNKVIMPGTSCSIGGDGNTFDTLICNNPGQAISIYNNVNVTVNSLFQADGNCNGLTSITSGGNATISKPTGTVTLNYVLLQGITGAGGATFIANNSVNGGNVTGITINAPAPQNLFWVGGTGNWNDLNHWSTISGGAGGSCVPSQVYNSVVDANSFPTAGDSVKINVPTIYCNTMDWSAAIAPVLYSTSNIRLNLYGSLILNNSLIWAVLGDIYLLSSTAGNIINTYGVVLQGQGSGTDLRFSGSGSWSLQSGISLGNSGSMRFDSGTFLSNGLPVICNDF